MSQHFILDITNSTYLSFSSKYPYTGSNSKYKMQFIGWKCVINLGKYILMLLVYLLMKYKRSYRLLSLKTLIVYLNWIYLYLIISFNIINTYFRRKNITVSLNKHGPTLPRSRDTITEPFKKTQLKLASSKWRGIVSKSTSPAKQLINSRSLLGNWMSDNLYISLPGILHD